MVSLVEDVELLSGCVLLEEFAGDLPFCSQDDSILGQYSEGRSSV